MDFYEMLEKEKRRLLHSGENKHFFSIEIEAIISSLKQLCGDCESIREAYRDMPEDGVRFTIFGYEYNKDTLLEAEDVAYELEDFLLASNVELGNLVSR